MSETPILRVSTMAQWGDCPRRGATRTFRAQILDLGYELRYPGCAVSAAIGTGLHAGASHILTERMSERTPKVTDAIELSITTYREEVAEGVDYDATTDCAQTAEKQLDRMTRVYMHSLAPRMEPVQVEQRLNADLPGGIILSGQADVIQTDMVRDLKTGRSAQTYHAQLGGYCMLAEANEIAAPTRTAIDWLKRTNIKDPQEDPITFEYEAELCKAEARVVLHEVVRQWERFGDTQRPDSFPTNTSSKLCSPKFCTAYGTAFCPVSQTIIT